MLGIVSNETGQISPRPEHIHLADEAILVNALALAALGLLGPHLLHVLENHVEVSVKSLDTGQELAVVTAGNQDLGVAAACGVEEGQRAGSELELLNLSNLILSVMRNARLVFKSRLLKHPVVLCAACMRM